VNSEYAVYRVSLSASHQAIGDELFSAIASELTEATFKIWHRHPVWFLNENPIVGFSSEKKGLRLMFWSGSDFDEPELNVKGGKFKDASIFYKSPDEVEATALMRWLEKGRRIQWDYKNIVKRKGVLVRITDSPSAD
jgi:hypothetical protein